MVRTDISSDTDHPGADVLDRLDEAERALFAVAAEQDFFLGLPWFRTLARTTLQTGEAVRLLRVGPRTAPEMLLPLVARREGRAGPRLLRGLCNYYSCIYRPPTARDGPAPDIAALRLVLRLRAERPSWDTLRLEAMDPDDALFAPLARTLEAHGFAVHPYFQFGNWFEHVAGADHAAFMAERPAPLRNTIRRKAARLERRHRVVVRIDRDGTDLDRALAAYQQVYARSWKPAEPFHRFIPALVRLCAASGSLRLGILEIDDRPVAAQIWIVWNGRATIYKLAHDEDRRADSPGSILTWHMIGHVLETDRVTEIDFGRGDDPYKRLWLPRRRERWGLMAINRGTPWGLALSLRHGIARAVAETRRNRVSRSG